MYESNADGKRQKPQKTGTAPQLACIASVYGVLSDPFHDPGQYRQLSQYCHGGSKFCEGRVSAARRRYPESSRRSFEHRKPGRSTGHWRKRQKCSKGLRRTACIRWKPLRDLSRD